MIAAAESSGCAAPDTSDVVVVERPVADVGPKLGQFRGELHCLFRSAHRARARGSIRRSRLHSLSDLRQCRT